jgi:hypothetical protein
MTYNTTQCKQQVRVVESEAAFKRLEAQQGSLSAALLATLALNAGMALTGSGGTVLRIGGKLMFAVSAVFGLQVPLGYLQLWRLQQKQNVKGFR